MSLQVLKNETMILPQEEILAVTPSKEFIPIKVEHYPGGEPMIKEIPEVIESLIVRPKSMEALVVALFLIDVLEDHDHPIVSLVLPYFPGARQDRINVSRSDEHYSYQGDILFTARSVARMINNIANVLTVKILDPHSEVVPALLNRCEVFDNTFVWGPEYDWSGWDYNGVIAPDGGAVKRATKVAELLNAKEFLHGWKHRDVTTGQITGFGLEPPSKVGGHYLVVDDICDGGGTFLGLTSQFVRYGITADLFVTHGIFSSPGNLYMLKKNYGKIYCSDSVLKSTDIRADGVNVIPVVERML